MAGNTRKILQSLLMCALLLAMPLPAHGMVEKMFDPPEDLGTVVESVATIDTAYGVEDGHDVMYATASGTPAVFNVIDLDDYRLLRSYPLPGASSSWTHVTDRDGNVYIGGSGKLFRYSPVTKEVTDLGQVPGASATYGLSVDERNRVYVGTYPQGKLFRYDPDTRQFRDYGTIVEGQNYVRGAAYYGGYVYAGIGAKGSLVRVNVETGEKQTIPIPDRPEYYDVNNLGFVSNLNTVRDLLFVHVANVLLVYDMTNGTWLPETYPNYRGLYTSPEHDGKTVFAADGRLYLFDLTTRQAVASGVSFGTYLRHSGWVDVPNDSDFPGKSLVTVQYGGQVTFFNFATNKLKTMPPVVKGQPTPIQTLEKGPDGLLYMSGYMGTFGAKFNPLTGEKILFNLGQAEGMAALGNKMYFGVYPEAMIYEMDTTRPPALNENPRLAFKIPDEQDRPFAMTAGDGKLFIGTIPTYGKLGGALSVYDGTTLKSYRNVVPNQSIIGLAYRNGKIYGSTSVWGGLGIEPSENEAKIFVWDVAQERKIAEFVPNLPNAGVKAKAIGGLSFGPDGFLWGAAYGTLFAMNPDTFEIVKSAEIYPTNWNFSHYWRPVYLRWGTDGYLYTTLGGKIVVVDPNTLERVELPNASLMTLGDDGHIYYAEGANIKRIKTKDGAPPVYADVPVPVPNAGFEEPLSNGKIPGWTSLFAPSPNTSYGVTDERSAEGAYSLKLVDTSTSETVALASDRIPVVPGTEYKLNAKVYLQSGRTIALLRFYDAADRELSSKAVYIDTGLGKWHDVEITGAAPAGAAYARIIAFCSQLWMTTAYYDDFRFSYRALDQTPPVTTAFVSPAQPDGRNGWHIRPVTVTLSAQDELTAIALTQYSLDGGANWQPYSAPIVLEADGTYEVLYRSKDKAGNTEAAKSVNVKIDKTAPTLSVTVNGTSLSDGAEIQDSQLITLALQAADHLSGVAGQTITVDGQPYVPGTALDWAGRLGTHVIEAVATDEAGNETRTVINVNVNTSIPAMTELLERYFASGNLSESMKKQLSKDLADAGKHLRKDKFKNAIDSMEHFLKTIDKTNKHDYISDPAKTVLATDAHALIRSWSGAAGDPNPDDPTDNRLDDEDSSQYERATTLSKISK